MTMLTDRYGLSLTTDSSLAREAYVQAIDLLLSANAGVDDALQQALAADPGFALAQVAQARWLQLKMQLPAAREAADRAAALARTASHREQQHVEIFRLLIHGKGIDALDLVRQHCAEYPRDAMALSPATGVFGLLGFSGRQHREAEQVELLQPLAAAYRDDWWFLSVYAFALIEYGRAQEGLELIERSLEISPRNAHAAHTLAHARYELGDASTTAAYLEQWLPDYSPRGQLHCHIWWHLAMCYLMLGKTQQMWESYRNHCTPAVSHSSPLNVITDGASLLWRAELAGEARNEQLWWDVRRYAEEQLPQPGIFADVHYAFILAATNDDDALASYIDRLQQAARHGVLPAGPVTVALAQAASAFHQGDWETTIETLAPVSDQVVRIGGSRAQRDLIENTLLAAYVKAGRQEEARSRMARRVDRTPAVPGLTINYPAASYGVSQGSRH
jgi:tetratricopeptide (TPR) repeat protein